MSFQSNITIKSGNKVAISGSSIEATGSLYGSLVSGTIGRFTSLSASSLRINNQYNLPTSDGNNGQVISTNGLGELSFSTIAAGGINTSVQFNKNSSFSGSEDLTYDYNTGILSGTISSFSEVNAGYIDFAYNGEPAHSTGRVFYDTSNDTFQYDTEVGGVSIKPGRQLAVRVRNASGNELTKGQIVRIVSSSNNSDTPSVSTASYSSEYTSADTLAMMMNNTDANQNGYALLYGVITNIDTDSYSVGDMLYLSSSGQFTNVIPQSPLHEVRVGQVVRKATNGTIYVKIQNGYETDELHDVLFSSKSTGDLISWDNNTGVWRNTKTLNGSYQVTSDLTASSVYVSNTIRTDGVIQANGGGIATNDGTFQLVNTTATNVLFGGASTTMSIGSTSGQTTIKNNLYVSGTTTLQNLTADKITAREYHTEIVSASVIYRAGSTKFGDDLLDTHQFTGSIRVNGTAQILGDTEITGLIKHGNNNIDLFENMVFKAGYTQSNFEFRDINNSGLLYISQSGDVGIGTNSPNAKFDVNGNAVVSGSLTVTDAVTATGFTGSLNGNADTATTATNLTLSATNGNNAYKIPFANITGNGNATTELLHDNAGQFTYNPSTNTLIVPNLDGNAATATSATSALTASSVQMELDYQSTSAKYLTFLDAYNPTPGNGQKIKTGYLLYYIPSSNTLYSNFNGSLTGNASSATSVNTVTNNDNAAKYVPFVNTDGNQGLQIDSGMLYVPASNTLTVGTLVETSTREIKENIKTIPKQLSKLKKLNPVRYNRINSSRDEIGLIAEEVNEVYPEFVHDKGINYPKMVSVLISAVQELTDKLEKQQREITSLKKRIK